jgi:signal-transduction protein with cAMP-binding, CBS, and nucleotidyltransferase domain
MQQRKLRHLIEDRQVVGILTHTDILRAFRRLHSKLLAVA